MDKSGKVDLNQALKEVRRQMRGKNREKKVKTVDEVAKDEIVERVPSVFKGTGRIMASGTTVHGIGTQFLKEVKQGDSIFIGNGKEEKRKVVLVLSDKSILISEGFQDEKNSEFFVESWPEVVEKAEDEEEVMKKKKKVQDGEVVYEIRVKRGPWTYKVATVKKKDEISHEELLNVRAQRVRDKFCWM